GRLVVAGSELLFLLDPASGQASVLGPEGGHGGEAYVAVSPAPALEVASSGCRFAPGEVYQLQLTGSPGVTRVDAQGQAHPFARVTGVDTLGGIVFDTSGRFGNRLLVSGSHGGHTTLVALDCTGRGQVVTDQGP